MWNAIVSPSVGMLRGVFNWWRQLRGRDLATFDENLVAGTLQHIRKLAKAGDAEALGNHVLQQNDCLPEGVIADVPEMTKEWRQIVDEAMPLANPLFQHSQGEKARAIKRIDALAKQGLRKIQARVRIARDPWNP